MSCHLLILGIIWTIVAKTSSSPVQDLSFQLYSGQGWWEEVNPEDNYNDMTGDNTRSKRSVESDDTDTYILDVFPSSDHPSQGKVLAIKAEKSPLELTVRDTKGGNESPLEKNNNIKTSTQNIFEDDKDPSMADELAENQPVTGKIATSKNRPKAGKPKFEAKLTEESEIVSDLSGETDSRNWNSAVQEAVASKQTGKKIPAAQDSSAGDNTESSEDVEVEFINTDENIEFNERNNELISDDSHEVPVVVDQMKAEALLEDQMQTDEDGNGPKMGYLVGEGMRLVMPGMVVADAVAEEVKSVYKEKRSKIVTPPMNSDDEQKEESSNEQGEDSVTGPPSDAENSPDPGGEDAHDENNKPPQSEEGGPPQSEEGGPPHGEEGELSHGEEGGPSHGEEGSPPHGEGGGPPQGEEGGPPQSEEGGPPQGGDNGPERGADEAVPEEKAENKTLPFDGNKVGINANGFAYTEMMAKLSNFITGLKTPNSKEKFLVIDFIVQAFNKQDNRMDKILSGFAYKLLRGGLAKAFNLVPKKEKKVVKGEAGKAELFKEPDSDEEEEAESEEEEEEEEVGKEEEKKPKKRSIEEGKAKKVFGFQEKKMRFW